MNDNSDQFDGSAARRTRRWLLRMAAAGAAAVPVAGLSGGVSQAAVDSADTDARNLPGLPKGFWGTFTSRRVLVGGMRLHAVTGGEGPAVLLIGGWPQTWYAWRHVMPALAKDFTVVAVDPRGVGLSDRPAAGYDSGTLANDSVA